MNTQTHLLLACAVLLPTAVKSSTVDSSSARITMIVAALLGALVPDASLFVMWGVAKAQGVADSVIWSDWYYSKFWQQIGAITNSLPVYAVVALSGFLIGGRWQLDNKLPASNSKTDACVNGATSGTTIGIEVMRFDSSRFQQRVGLFVLIFAVAAVMHVLTDLPLHHDDGHPHFWPLTDWIYRSPVSYWDPAHYGHIWSLVEFLLAILLIAVLWRRFNMLVSRVVLSLTAVSYIVVSLYWWQLT